MPKKIAKEQEVAKVAEGVAQKVLGKKQDVRSALSQMSLEVFKQVGSSNLKELADHMAVVKDEALQVWMPDKEISSVMTAYASSHKTQQDFRENQHTQTPLLKGKNANAELFKFLTPLC